MRVLVTGFEKFGVHSINPSEDLVRSLEDRSEGIRLPERPNPDLECPPDLDLTTAVLPVGYRSAETAFLRALEVAHPDLVLAFGVGAPGPLITLERLGINIDDASAGDGRPDSGLPDNEGEVRVGSRIIDDTDAPPAYWSTVPIDRILTSLHSAGIGARASNHAGSFLCNHLLYYGLHLAATEAGRTIAKPFRMGFIHVPPYDAMGEEIDSEERKIRTCETRGALEVMIQSLLPGSTTFPENSTA